MRSDVITEIYFSTYIILGLMGYGPTKILSKGGRRAGAQFRPF